MNLYPPFPKWRIYRGQPPLSESELCDVCNAIDFDRYLFHKMSRDVPLGAWRRIVQNPFCPFCRLVVVALRENSSQSLIHPNDEIILNNLESWELGIEISPHDRLKSDAYSNMLDLRSRAKDCRDVAHRFVVTVEDQLTKAYLQYLVPRQLPKEERQFFGRTIDRETVDVRLLKSWLRRCKTWHENTCEEDGIAGRRLPYKLRLIDVRKRAIVKAPDPKGLHYLTLSYVWGTEDMERESGMKPVVTNRADIQFKDDIEFTPLSELLPNTIEDAIWLTLALGFRYLWVDALCIIQDDPPEEKKRHLDKMDAVYNCSTLTIAAASGRHADSGIPGISTRRKVQHSENIKGLQLATMSPSFSELEGSKSLIWNTRGWTFQEKILAKRLLLFTESQVYYKCSEAIWTEEIIMETGRLSKSIEARKAKYRWAADRPHYAPDGKSTLLKMVIPQLNVDDQWNYLGMFPDYAMAVREYTQRTLTKPDDTLIAIGGVFRTLQPDSGEFHFGLPSAYFLQALLWYPEPGSHHVRTNHELPSWTWASWQVGRGISYDVLDVRMLRAIMITLRNLMVGVGHVLGAMAQGAGEGSSTSSDSSYTDTSWTSSSSSSSAPSSSTPSSYTPPRPPRPPRDWSTMSILGKATMNMSSCFGWPLLFRDHTVKDMVLCADGSATILNCGETFALSTFLQEENKSSDSINKLKSLNESKSRSISPEGRYYNKKLAARTRIPLLSMQTVVVRFSIGSCLHTHEPTDENESSIFELLDSDNLCVGEVYTTLEYARKGRRQPFEFITICWGLSLGVAAIAEEHIPRWTFDAAKLPKAKTLVSWKTNAEETLRLLIPAKKKIASRSENENGEGGMLEQLPATAFFEALFKAKKGEKRPKFLWSTVNLIAIEREKEGRYARRIGVGKVIFEAWMGLYKSTEEVLLA